MLETQLFNAIQNVLPDPGKIFWKEHALMRMRQRGIRIDDVFEVLQKGHIIEIYQSDKPFPSVLINGKTTKNRPIHVVVGINAGAGEIHIVTSYEPDPQKWEQNFGKRK